MLELDDVLILRECACDVWLNLTIFFFSGVAMHERMRYYIRNTRIMQGIKNTSTLGTLKPDLPGCPFRCPAG